MSEKMREEFEGWFESSYGFCLSKDDETTYSTPWVNDMYHAWKASRAALVVEFPLQFYSQTYDDEMMHASHVMEELDAAGVKFK